MLSLSLTKPNICLGVEYFFHIKLDPILPNSWGSPYFATTVSKFWGSSSHLKQRLRQLLADLDARTRSLWGFYLMLYGNMEVSISGGTPKWMVYSGKSIYKCMLTGVFQLFHGIFTIKRGAHSPQSQALQGILLGGYSYMALSEHMLYTKYKAFCEHVPQVECREFGLYLIFSQTQISDSCLHTVYISIIYYLL